MLRSLVVILKRLSSVSRPHVYMWQAELYILEIAAGTNSVCAEAGCHMLAVTCCPNRLLRASVRNKLQLCRLLAGLNKEVSEEAQALWAVIPA